MQSNERIVETTVLSLNRIGSDIENIGELIVDLRKKIEGTDLDSIDDCQHMLGITAITHDIQNAINRMEGQLLASLTSDIFNKPSNGKPKLKVLDFNKDD